MGAALDRLCRACGALSSGALSSVQAHCGTCGAKRFVHHAEISSLSIAHIDCDAFFASIEKRDRPDLADKPVIIGGGRRGVVSTACYIARLYGVRSAMPMFKALAACPDAVVIRPDMSKYVTESRRLRVMMQDLTPLVEPLSIDEAFLDLTGTSRLHGAPPASMLARLQNRVAKEIGITVSVGLSHNKFLAKTASDLDKPNGFSVIGKAETLAFLAPRPVGSIHGVGPQFAKKLQSDGLSTLADLQAADPKDLMRRYGESGLRLARLCRGEDTRHVEPDHDRKSVSSETTFDTDLRDLQTLTDHLWRLCVKTADRAKAEGVAGRVITLKLKRSDFQTVTRRRSVEEAIQLSRPLFAIARAMLEKEIGANAYRLIGVGLSALEPAQSDRADLIDQGANKRAKAERASDTVRARFGRDTVQSGRALRSKPPANPSPHPRGKSTS